MTKALMVQGTASHAGKSVITAMLCAHFRKKGLRVAPFKAQNMSNNAAVTREGGEIGRAQAVQAEACGLEPSNDMNPILLKSGRGGGPSRRGSPSGGIHVVVNGRSVGDMSMREYYRRVPEWTRVAHAAFDRLAARMDLVILEGAGSPAEINLKRVDLVNMAMARYARAKVILVGDIERGGVFASLLGTMETLSLEERHLIGGFIINKFRGDPSLLTSGLAWLKRKTGRPVWGVLPFMSDLDVPEEDAVGLDSLIRNSPPPRWGRNEVGVVKLAIVHLPHISNFTDFEAFKREPDVSVRLVRTADDISQADAIVLPGSKATMRDLQFLIDQGMASRLRRARREGAEIVGVCGGYQMMGDRIDDPYGVEGMRRRMKGLGLLHVTTAFQRKKLTANVMARHVKTGERVRGYQIHLGEVRRARGVSPVFKLEQSQGVSVDLTEGAESGRLWGTTIHGVFDSPGFRRTWLNRLRARKGWKLLASNEVKRDPFADLLKVSRRHLDMKAIERLIS